MGNIYADLHGLIRAHLTSVNLKLPVRKGGVAETMAKGESGRSCLPVHQKVAMKVNAAHKVGSQGPGFDPHGIPDPLFDLSIP